MALMPIRERRGHTCKAVTPGCVQWRQGAKQWKAVRLP